MTRSRHARRKDRRFVMKLISIIVAGSACGSSIVLAVTDGSVLYLAAACLACVVTLLAALA